MRQEGQRGVVLVAVLFAVAIMSVMVTAVTSLTREGIASQGLEARRFASNVALRSGLESAKALIVSTPPEQRMFFDGTPIAVEVGDGLQVEVTIRDAAGLIDINRSELPLVEAVLWTSLDAAETAELAGRISELRNKAKDKAKAEAEAKPVDPAAAAKGEAGKKDDIPAPILFVSVDQMLAEVKLAAAVELAGLLTVFNPTGRVNPLAAPEDVLLAIPGITPADLAAIKAARKSRAPNVDQALRPVLERLKSSLAIMAPTVFVIGVRLQGGPGIIAHGRAGAVVQPVEAGPLPFRTLWVSGL